MIGLTAGLQIARKALAAYQLAISVHGNNVANVNTEGYSRRRIILKDAESTAFSFGHVGLGVDVETICRMRDRFLDDAYRNENAYLGKHETMEWNLSEIEMILNEPSDTGLGSLLGDFWDGWQDLANQPESQVARGLVRDRATSLCDALRRLDDRLNTMRDSLNEQIKVQIEDINILASKIAALNSRIVTGEVSGHESSQLRDERDRLLDQLSGIVDIKVFERDDGTVAVMIGTDALVERDHTVPILLEPRTEDGIIINAVILGGLGRPIGPPGGKIAGLLECRDTLIPDYIDRLNTLARAIVENVNEVHRLGYGLDDMSGRDFFDPDGITAATISVSEFIVTDVSLIAASTDGSPGNSDNALAIAALRSQGIIGDDGSNVDEYYSSLIGSLGLQSSRAARARESQEVLLQEIDNRRESVRGVSIDEEMTDLLAAQHAYQAAARLLTTVDELLVSLMSSVGR
jgi:flagellar hook-associated protein 1 FlgK